MTKFPLWKLSCLLDEDWLEEDVLNAMAEHLYFRIAAEADDMDFVYLPTLAFNDDRHLYTSDKHVYGPNLAAFRRLLSEEPIETIAFNVWHSDHYHTFYYNSTEGSLIHSDSQHGLGPDDVLPILNWLLHGTSYPYPRQIDEGKIQLQGIGGGFGSCAVAAHKFIECQADDRVLQWDPTYSEGFQDKALIDLIMYHCGALKVEIWSHCWQLTVETC